MIGAMVDTFELETSDRVRRLAFDTQKGALSYHQAVTAYACRYSSEVFSVPGGGVGLRILYGSGDPVRDQVAWIDVPRES